ncbi:uncharacterized protein LOC133517409 [Cydia pomonella]|uniref:uncharacterized protein LOC133517409 n=1 Tax=Cydia pomonella TaxID=82600 RepID=UPI002ADD50C3|nr:uncharacterized protein LOC133517409 [Cydia pomonella]
MDTAAFVRANSSNLPKVDPYMLMEFMKNSDEHNAGEIRDAKALSSSRESYVETAIGYVETKRTGNLCDVRAKVVPEQRITSKYYVVMVHLEEANESIIDTSCDCAAGAGGCKHTVVVLHWLQKRSAEPSPTSIQCYWTKPSLKRALDKPLMCKDLAKGEVAERGPKDPLVLKRLRQEATKHGCGKSLLMVYDPERPMKMNSKYCIFDMMVDFLEKESRPTFNKFKIFSNAIMLENKEKIMKDTVGQVNSKQWHSIRQGRITGSKIYEIAHCKTPHGSLVEEILGGCKAPETKSMKRGKILEKRVLNKVKTDINKEIKECGFLIIDGIFGASPDGVGDDFVVEIKCPISEKTKKNYIKNGQIANKFMGQVQLEMLAAGKNKCLLCVADPKFESNSLIETIVVNFDKNYIDNLMRDAEKFWDENVYPVILKSASTA